MQHKLLKLPLMKFISITHFMIEAIPNRSYSKVVPMNNCGYYLICPLTSKKYDSNVKNGPSTNVIEIPNRVMINKFVVRIEKL